MMKILWCGIFIKRTISIVVVSVFCNLHLIDCCCCNWVLFEEELELDIMLTKKFNVLQNWAVVKRVSSLVTDSAWSGCIECSS